MANSSPSPAAQHCQPHSMPLRHRSLRRPPPLWRPFGGVPAQLGWRTCYRNRLTGEWRDCAWPPLLPLRPCHAMRSADSCTSPQHTMACRHGSQPLARAVMAPQHSRCGQHRACSCRRRMRGLPAAAQSNGSAPSPRTCAAYAARPPMPPACTSCWQWCRSRGRTLGRCVYQIIMLSPHALQHLLVQPALAPISSCPAPCAACMPSAAAPCTCSPP